MYDMVILIYILLAWERESHVSRKNQHHFYILSSSNFKVSSFCLYDVIALLHGFGASVWPGETQSLSKKTNQTDVCSKPILLGI